MIISININKMKSHLILLIGITLLISSCKNFKEVTVTGVDGFSVKKIDAKEMQAELKLLIKNNNSFGFSIYPSEFDIMFSGINLGKAKLHKRVHINGNTEQVYSFDLKSNLGDLNFIDVARLLGSNNSGKLEVKGDLKTGKFYLKKKFLVNYSDKVNLFR